VSEAIETAAPGGRVVAFAGFGNEPAAVIDMNRIHYGEVELVGSHWVGTPPNQRLDRYAQARDLLASPDLALEQLVSWMIGFEQVEDALVRHADHRGLKTVLIPGQSR
jgi:threonine dehydrogenase-like Zn-dependent dehydrogenase